MKRRLSRAPEVEASDASSGIFRTDERVSASTAIVRTLWAAGIDTYFGLPGGPIIPLFDAILGDPRVMLVEPRQETCGAFAAMGFHRATGRVPAVVVTAGPGATNVLTGVVAAHLERTPMIVICGDVPWAATGMRLAQHTGGDGIGVERIFAGVTRTVVRVARGESAAAQVQRAIDAATDPEHPGPVLVVLSVDQAGAPVTTARLHAPPRAVEPRAPSLPVLAAISRQLARAERPLLVVGAGARSHEAAVLRMVEALSVPFVTTPMAKGILPESHPLSLRACGLGASWWARRYMRAGCDATVVLGTDLDDSAMAGTPPIGPGGHLAHVDLDPSVFGRNHPTAMGIVADVGAFAASLAAFGAPRSRRGPALAAEIHAESPFDVPEFASDAATPIAPHRVIADLEAASRPDDILVSDIGEHMLFALHYLTIDRPDRFAVHLGLGSMGSGIGSAIGLALGARGRRVLCVCGDGGMQMAGMELLVARKHGLPVVLVVFNDARYNMVFHGYRHTFGREAAWDAPRVDFAAWARSIGVASATIERPGQITGPLLDELTAHGPAVLDVRQDANVRIRGDGRIEAIAQMSMLHARPT